MYEKFKNEELQKPELLAEYIALEPEFPLMKTMIDARHQIGITQKQLSEKTRISQGDISKYESGNGNPSIKTLQRIANGLGMCIKIEFTPMSKA